MRCAIRRRRRPMRQVAPTERVGGEVREQNIGHAFCVAPGCFDLSSIVVCRCSHPHRSSALCVDRRSVVGNPFGLHGPGGRSAACLLWLRLRRACAMSMISGAPPRVQVLLVHVTSSPVVGVSTFGRSSRPPRASIFASSQHFGRQSVHTDCHTARCHSRT